MMPVQSFLLQGGQQMTDARPYEQLDLFYLGRELDADSGETGTLPLLYRHKHLKTHAAIIGMTGSGKTGLGIGLLEEAAMDRIPAIIIDPKGDMGNLLLSFPDLAPGDFQPWVDPVKAEREDLSVEELAEQTAEAWKKGLQDWNQDGERIRRMREQTEFSLFTPGRSSGRPLSLVNSLEAPDASLMEESEAAAGLVNAAVSSLLGLLGITADPLKSREHILLSSLLLTYWRRGEGLELPSLISAVVDPPFTKVGVFPVERFFPRDKRLELALQLNTIMASPSFAGWLEGEPLEIEHLLYTGEGRPRLSILSIAHLSDDERMFFVTMLLGRLIGWMRRQEGASGLRCLLYMDEVFGFFPPTGNPPSKKPMLLLLKQARAYGVGVVLATQNPVDLDYKALANIGTWFIGRLQTRQDQDRVMTGIGAAAGGRDISLFRRWLADMRSRTFLLHSAHREVPIRFEARWAMSYLKGPLSMDEIGRLTADALPGDSGQTRERGSEPASVSAFTGSPPLLARGMEQLYVPPPVPMEEQQLAPWLYGTAEVRYVDKRRAIDQREEVAVRLPLEDGYRDADWSVAEPFAVHPDDLRTTPPGEAHYKELPPGIAALKSFRQEKKALADHLYHERRLPLMRVTSLKLESVPGETAAAFHTRRGNALREARERVTDKLKERYAGKLRQLELRLERAQARIDKEQTDVKARGMDTALSFGVAIFGALFGRKALSVTTASRTARSMRSAGRIFKEKADVQRAVDEAGRLEEEIARLGVELEEKLAQELAAFAPELHPVESFYITPRRSDIISVRVSLLWEPIFDFEAF
ncbi:MAG: ATP-binding protein [Desulfobulbus propionicus]|nr:MAG: ATP-binding protein [Desulfobulbus propionicus]